MYVSCIISFVLCVTNVLTILTMKKLRPLIFDNQLYVSGIFTNNDQLNQHRDDVIMSTVASQITSLTIVYSSVYSGADQRKRQSSASLAFVLGIHRRPVNSPHKWPITRKMFIIDYAIMTLCFTGQHHAQHVYWWCDAGNDPGWRLSYRTRSLLLASGKCHSILLTHWS